MPPARPSGKSALAKGKFVMKKGVLKRLIGILFKNYTGLVTVIALCIILSAVAGSVASPFLQEIYSAIAKGTSGEWSASGAWNTVLAYLSVLAGIYVLGLLANLLMGQISAILTQKFLADMRNKVFAKMQTLPIRYFDRNTHGDIMSIYTNDIDALRQLISQSLPQICSTAITLITLTFSMLYISALVFGIVLVGVVFILFVTKTVGSRSARYFMAQQRAVGRMEGYIEEIMHGQKVVKVFCHEDATIADFNAVNGALSDVSYKANAFSNMLMPIIHNIGNILCVAVAFIGCAIAVNGGYNVGFKSLFETGSFAAAMTFPTVFALLGAARQFANSMGQVSGQINSVIMAMAGASRVFDLLDEPSENYDGYVTLVNVFVNGNGELEETTERTGIWAWKHPHGDGTTTYTRLEGDIVMQDVDFGYVPEKIVLHDVSLFARPGQQVAFVGATGAGKTTITNLLNRFYDIADGKIRYDGININKIRKKDLRRSLGMVLQDTNLFTGTVMDNIRYGRLDATDEECIEAAKLANAHDFITRLPQGYQTMLVSDGANLSQGQRQLLSIARAAVADAPVMILDEATSSIDTRTEALVQKGMDSLMKGRTVFVIAHRLSTVQNSDVIMMLDHGRIIERGTHDDLIAKKGEYYSLYTGALELE